MEYENSLYNHLFKQSEDTWFLFNAQSRFFSEISADLAQIIIDREWSELSEEVLNTLIKHNVIHTEGHKYDFYDASLIRFNAQINNPTTLNLVIAPTTACNFECPYCFEPKMTPKKISDEVIARIESFVRAHSDAQRLSITWYGGEPLLAFPKIKEIYEILTKDGMPEIIGHTIVSNGYLFDEEVCSFFQGKHLQSIQITLDGVKAHHDTTRCLKGSKEPTFDIIYKNIRLIADMLPDTAISIRVNIDKYNWQDLVSLDQQIKHDFPDNTNISVYPGLIRNETSDGRSLCASSFVGPDVHDLYSKLRDTGMDTSLFPKRVWDRGCMIHAVNSYIIGPEGELYKCWNDVSDMSKTVGSIFSDSVTHTRRLLDYMTVTVPFDENCRECSVFPICDGGCGLYRYRNVRHGGLYNLCCAYRDPEKLKDALLKGIIAQPLTD